MDTIIVKKEYLIEEQDIAIIIATLLGNNRIDLQSNVEEIKRL